VLVVHGIGNQEPLQTLDQFGRGLLDEFRARGVALELVHGLAPLPGDRYGVSQWLRLQPRGGGPALDLFEYYWADIPQDRAPVGAIQRWLDSAVAGAKDFYEDNRDLVEKYEQGGSLFFKNGHFNYWRYWRFLFVVGQVIPFTTGSLQWSVNAVRSVPVLGQFLSAQIAKIESRILDVLANVVGDIVVFNSVQARSPFLELRNRILTGCVAMIQKLVTPGREGESDEPWSEKNWAYDRVIVASHSLGTQVSFEAINRLNVMAAAGQLHGIDAKGRFTDGKQPITVRGKERLAELFGGYVTFGSPLDKVAFFFREQASKDETIRRRMLSHLRCFKQKPWDVTGGPGVEDDGFRPPLDRLLDEVRWVNYFDRHDPVSGSLDYYEPLDNRNCGFKVKHGPGAIRALRVGGLVWLIAFVGALAYWGVKMWHFGWDDIQRFSVSGFLLDHWQHWVGLGLFAAGTVMLLVGVAYYFAGNFTHLRYWNRAESPLYRDLVDEFLYAPVVTKMTRETAPTGDVA
jgi:hypothetical protein